MPSENVTNKESSVAGICATRVFKALGELMIGCGVAWTFIIANRDASLSTEGVFMTISGVIVELGATAIAEAPTAEHTDQEEY